MAGGAVLPTVSSNNRSYLKGRQLIYPLSLAISLFFLWGFSYGLLDVLNKHFQNVLRITRLESTALQIVYFGGGYFCFSPIAAELLKRKGYKITIVTGLALFAIGAIFFWPTAQYSTPANAKRAFGGFIVCTFVIACGLATVETAANSYATIIGNPKSASMRLQFCQSWNGVASFIGPLIASKLFFSGEDVSNLDNVKYVYISVALAAVLVAVLFIFSKIPEVQIDDEDQSNATDEKKPLWKEYNMIFAFVAQFCYVGAQVIDRISSFRCSCIRSHLGHHRFVFHQLCYRKCQFHRFTSLESLIVRVNYIHCRSIRWCGLSTFLPSGFHSSRLFRR